MHVFGGFSCSMRQVLWPAVTPCVVRPIIFCSFCFVGAARISSLGMRWQPGQHNSRAPAANAGARAPSQNQTAPSAPQIIAAKSQISGQFTHTAKRGESVGSLVHIYLPQTTYMTAAELTSAIARPMEPAAIRFDRARRWFIPGFETAPILEKPIAVGWDFEVRAVYLTGAMASSERGLRIINRWRQMGGNSVVFDIKDSDGVVNIPFRIP